MSNQFKNEESIKFLHKNRCRESKENERGRKETGKCILYISSFQQRLIISLMQCNKLFLAPQRGKGKN